MSVRAAARRLRLLTEGLSVVAHRAVLRETFGRSKWLGRETGHSAEAGHNRRQATGLTTYRKGLVGKLVNAMVKEFFVSRFDRWNDRYRDEAIEPVLNKVGQFLSSPIMVGIVEQPGGKLDLRDIMDEGKILIVNLSKGRVGEDNAALLGLDDNKLTYFHAGRFKQLSQFGGKVIDELIT